MSLPEITLPDLIVFLLGAGVIVLALIGLILARGNAPKHPPRNLHRRGPPKV